MRTGLNIMLVGLIILAGCAKDNISPATAQLDRQYAGHKVDDFFLNYGKPTTGKAADTADGKIYHWVTIQPVMDGPMTAGFRGSPGIAVAAPDQPAEYLCELNIFTSKGGAIQKFTILNDTYSSYTSSYCNDLLGAPPQHRTL